MFRPIVKREKGNKIKEGEYGNVRKVRNSKEGKEVGKETRGGWKCRKS